MKRALIASTVVLTAVLAFLLYQRFTATPLAPPPAAHPAPQAAAPATPPAPAAPAPAAGTVAPAHAEAQGAEAAAPGEPAKGPAASPTEAGATPAAAAPGTPAARATATLAEPPSPPAAGRPAVAPLEARPAAPRRAGPTAPDEAAAAAIFSDRPPIDPASARSRTPRIPVLRKPGAGVAPPSYVTAAAAARTTAPRAAATAHPASAHAASGTRPAAGAPLGPAPAAPATAAAPAPRLPGAVSGTLRDAGGATVAGVSVLAVSAAGDDAFETVTDDDGFYLLAAMPPGRYLLFTGLGQPGAPALPARAVEVRNGRVARVELRPPSGGATVRVRPLEGDGRPAPGQALLVAGPVPSPAPLQALLGSDAIFLPEAGGGVLRHVPAGVYTLVLLQGAGRGARIARQPVVVRGSGDQSLEVRLADDAAPPSPSRG